MINEAIREKYGRDPEEIFRRSQAAYARAYARGEMPPWAKHDLPRLSRTFAREVISLTALNHMAKHFPDKPLEEPLILDAGCGTGDKARQLSEIHGLSVIGIDYEQEAVNRAVYQYKIVNKSDDLDFVQGDIRKLRNHLPSNHFLGVFDYQALASNPPEFWDDIVKGYYDITKPSGLLLIDLLNIESAEFHGDIQDQVADTHEFVFDYNPNDPKHKDLAWEQDLYVYFFDQNEAVTVFGKYYNLITLERRMHPNGKRVLWSALLRSKKR
jgi:SAM-dependent methyltransferase